MKLWTTLIFLSYIWTINASEDNEDETVTLNPNEYSPQFLRAEELPIASPSVATTDEILEFVKTSLSADTDDIKTKRELTTSLEVSTPIPEITTFHVIKLNEYIADENSTSSVNKDQTKFSRNVETFNNLNTSNENDETIEHKKKQLTETELLNNSKHVNNVTEFLKTGIALISNGSIQAYNNNITNEMKSTNISLIYSKPYQPGKDLENAEKLIVIYPERINDLNISSETTTAMNQGNKTSGKTQNEQTMQGVNDTNININVGLTSIKKDETIKERVKQIRHDLYKRRPMTHYLLKAKTNDKLINTKDELSTSTKDLIHGLTDTPITIKPFNILRKIKDDSIENVFNDSSVESINKMRRRNGLSSESYPDNADPNDNNTETQMEFSKTSVTVKDSAKNNLLYVANKTNGKIDQHHLNNASIKGENLYVSETQFHSSIIYNRKNNDKNTPKIQQKHSSYMNDHANNSKTDLDLMNKEIFAENIQKFEDKLTEKSLHSTPEKPFRPSPEYNPRDIHVYDMHFQRLKMFSEDENTPLKPAQQTTHERYISTTIKPTISPSIMENMMLMLKQLKRLPSRQHKRINSQAASNDTHFNSDNLEHIDKYESKKIRPLLQRNRLLEKSTQNPVSSSLSESKDETVTSTTKNPLIIYRDNLRKMLRQRGSLRIPDSQTKNPMILNANENLKQVVKLSDDNTNLGIEHYKINNTMQMLPKLEHILKTNILMDLEKIKFMMLSKNPELQAQSLKQVQSQNMSTALINNLGINPQNLKRVNDKPNQQMLSMQHKANINTTSLIKSGNRRRNYLRNQTNKKLTIKETTTVVPVTKSEETNSSQNNKKRRLNARQRQRYQGTDRKESVKSDDNLMTRRNNYRSQPTTRRNKPIDHEILKQDITTIEPELKRNNSTKNETEVIIKTTENSIKRLLEGRRRNIFRSRKTNENMENNKSQTESTGTMENTNKEVMKTQELKFINKNYDNILSTTINYKNSDTIINNSESKFSNIEFELHGSSSEGNISVATPLESNKELIISSIDKNPNNTSDKNDLITLESRQNEETYPSQFEPPTGFQSGFIPMVFDLGAIVGPVPRALKVSEKPGKVILISPSKLPESVDQIQNIDIVSPNILTNYGNIGRVPSKSTNESEKIADKNNDDSDEIKMNSNGTNKTADLKTEGTDIFYYDAALQQYNEALKTYNNYLQQFIQNKKQN